MNTEELTRYKTMSVEDIDRKIIPDIEDINNNKSIDPISMYFMNIGNVLVKCSYAKNGRSLEECFFLSEEKSNAT